VVAWIVYICVCRSLTWLIWLRLEFSTQTKRSLNFLLGASVVMVAESVVVASSCVLVRDLVRWCVCVYQTAVHRQLQLFVYRSG
jgi:hypothetical protein